MSKLSAFLSFLCALSQKTEHLPLIAPAKWGAVPAKCSGPLKKVPPEYVVIIHTAGSYCHTQTECSRILRDIQALHMNDNNWCNIAYNFLIGEDGNVYQAVGWLGEGEHTFGYNDLSLGIAFIGDFTKREPNAAAWNALKNLLSFAVKNGYLASNYLLLAHGDVSNTLSPGKYI
uniref:Peptidoglycan-recognition protein n=1 Tax=Sphenodon punctatus TaxID=8508 RepID=A0A8D0GFQ1_SPHPU